MFIIGLTGSLGTGKSTVAGMFKKKGARVLDADEITHALMGPKGECFNRIASTFGKEILSNGAIDRKKLAAIVFDSPAALKKLTAIIHPAVIREIKRKLGHSKKKEIIIIDAPLLIEAGLHRFSDILIVVKANRQLQIKRVVKRSKITKSEAQRRIKSQMPIAKKIEMADIVIDNRGNFRQTRKQTEEIWQRLSRKRQKT